ncbi:MAG TPA: 16S rRNA (adenine(1518)-N(6)/adenine(1519)-N(6))-dimethyltransferase RsmA [Planctomycetaceae bacterium]|jgi:16S rRNA (adenine1518-N6/adenine1519-N6)-dimethyltransferase|nr:16S rRNA (adenine(1518)-N(6)/adenine(1519)-N(6))-dimethyltransferase RsmA [Planctomycetaceae bacterium]
MRQAARQTRTHIGELLARHGVNPRHELGQNFLIDLNLVEFLVSQADLATDDVVLEVGSGTGGLTTFLAELAGAVIAVEVDSRMQRLTAEAVDGFPNVTILGCDVLKNKNHFSQPVLDALNAAMAEPSKRLKLVANLPYGVATPVISNLVASDFVWECMLVTIQLELAERMVAKEGSSSYGALSVWLSAQCHIELLKRLPANVFWPRPKVESAMIRIDPDPDLRQTIRDRAFLHDFLRGVFQQRRKMLRNVLVPLYRNDLDRTQIDAVLRAQELGERVRAEDLSPAILVGLANAIFETIQQTRGAEP